VVVERSDELIGLLVTAGGRRVPAGRRRRRGFRVPVRSGRNIDRAFLGIARPGNMPTVLLDARALFD
jgi:hypothetical protein